MIALHHKLHDVFGNHLARYVKHRVLLSWMWQPDVVEKAWRRDIGCLDLADRVLAVGDIDFGLAGGRSTNAGTVGCRCDELARLIRGNRLGDERSSRSRQTAAKGNPKRIAKLGEKTRGCKRTMSIRRGGAALKEIWGGRRR
jgi:hypothetical protein